MASRKSFQYHNSPLQLSRTFLAFSVSFAFLFALFFFFLYVVRDNTIHTITISVFSTQEIHADAISEEKVKKLPESSRSNSSSTNGGATGMFTGGSSCDIFDGKWVVDELSGQNYPPGSCPFIDESFDCFKNGRPDIAYSTLRWQPNRCNLPRLEGKKMLEMLRGKRLAFVGDSLNRNMWESLVCILRHSLDDKDRVFEISGKRQFKTESFYAFIFQDYNCTIEFMRSPFLVQEWESVDSGGQAKEILRLDMIDRCSAQYKDADVLIFNSGHWWTHPRTTQGKEFYQEGDHLYKQLGAREAYRKALITWARWIDANIDPTRTLVFFRGYSASHFNGGQWNTGGTCDGETVPIENEKHLGRRYPLASIAESVVMSEMMKVPVVYLNVTRMTDYRKDGHPSVYTIPPPSSAKLRKTTPSALLFQDCSHWCLPGVPDAWNQILYAFLLQNLEIRRL